MVRLGIKEGPKEPIKKKEEEKKENPKKREVKAEEKKKEPAKKEAPPKAAPAKPDGDFLYVQCIKVKSKIRLRIANSTSYNNHSNC